ncbi:hypothetical protein [Kaistia terrae]|uniref:Uncharacterized protein n=1 Tax=Kaistia terrae TaxID=537017 RepID=A0ABW0Q318_9HYPH|nr:hypothetical protein [Kaistia terrae]MCX5581310.1 hypothetical protein [Kaistia terrae]
MLVPNWRAVLRYAWSLKLILLIAAIQGLDAAMPLIGLALPIPAGWLAVITTILAILAAFSRLIPQKALTDG